MISDTHGLLRPEVGQCFAGVAHIIHAGDIGGEHVLEGLRRIAPVTAIRGNVDSGDWARNYRDTETIRLGRYVFYVLHDLTELESKPAPDGIDAVIYGHSHRASIRTQDGVLYLNPGSAGPRRFKLPISLATLDLDDGAELRPVLHTLGEA
ncbi:metallophosphoesterase family protein [Bradyrhizobium sp. PMVTL-01]|uniref:metallophosphoesterase family protein n=1 Tax=unclassified Bradyrhizobium TaxID=2631580 RepID=UPI003F728ED2